MQLILIYFLFLNVFCANAQEKVKDTAYLKCNYKNNSGGCYSKSFKIDFYGRMNVLVFETHGGFGDNYFIYDSKKHKKWSIDKWEYMSIVENYDNDYFFQKVNDEVDKKYAKKRKEIAPKYDRLVPPTQPTPMEMELAGPYYIDFCKVYLLEKDRDGTYTKYEVDWAFIYMTL